MSVSSWRTDAHPPQCSGPSHIRPTIEVEDPNSDSNNTRRPRFVFSPPPTKERAGEKEKRGVGGVEPNKPPTFNSQTEPNISPFQFKHLTNTHSIKHTTKTPKKNKIKIHSPPSLCRSGSLSLLRFLSSSGDPARDSTVLIAPSTLPSTSDLDTRLF